MKLKARDFRVNWGASG